jgi:hypothetical protein
MIAFLQGQKQDLEYLYEGALAPAPYHIFSGELSSAQRDEERPFARMRIAAYTSAITYLESLQGFRQPYRPFLIDATVFSTDRKKSLPRERITFMWAESNPPIKSMVQGFEFQFPDGTKQEFAQTIDLMRAEKEDFLTAANEAGVFLLPNESSVNSYADLEKELDTRGTYATSIEKHLLNRIINSHGTGIRVALLLRNGESTNSTPLSVRLKERSF